jgi:UDP-2,3-diacylglucosamine pyrophosphatase LpxH
MPEPPRDPEYVEAILKGLDDAYDRAPVEDLDLERDRIVVFSDHHKGAGDKADDFRHCEHAYASALGYYLEEKYRLFVLGDAEELWEESPRTVITRYREVLRLEGEFQSRRGAGLERFWGNHDDLWSHAGQVRKHLKDALGVEIEVREALRLRVSRPGRTEGTLFFVHGHQGTAESDKWGWLSRLPVRYFWRPFQRITGYSATTPASDHALRAKHDRAMFEWAKGRRGVVLIAGHTHHPVFGRSKPDPPATRPVADLEEALERARGAQDAVAAAAARAELEYAFTAQRRPDTAVTLTPPCYFNTGCCSFPDGDVTGLEIADGEMRLVRWPANFREMRPHPAGDFDPDARILTSETLDNVLDAVTAPPEAASIVESPVLPPGS